MREYKVDGLCARFFAPSDTRDGDKQYAYTCVRKQLGLSRDKLSHSCGHTLGFRIKGRKVPQLFVPTPTFTLCSHVAIFHTRSPLLGMTGPEMRERSNTTIIIE